MSDYYDTDDADAPRELTEYHGLRVGMRVRYENPAWRQPDGTYRTGGMDGPLIVSALYAFGERDVQAVLNDGEIECNADNLTADE